MSSMTGECLDSPLGFGAKETFSLPTYLSVSCSFASPIVWQTVGNIILSCVVVCVCGGGVSV